jgi:cell division protein FtsW (lipid II flippase)
MSAMDVPGTQARAAGRCGRGRVTAKTGTRVVSYISWVALALMTTSSVASLRPAPTMAVYGLASLVPVRHDHLLLPESLLGFVASTLAYVINPDLASSGVWTAIVIMVCYWTGVWVSSRGTGSVAGLASIAEIILMGVEEPRALIHAPNESVDSREIAGMALAEALFLQRYA